MMLFMRDEAKRFFLILNFFSSLPEPNRRKNDSEFSLARARIYLMFYGYFSVMPMHRKKHARLAPPATNSCRRNRSSRFTRLFRSSFRRIGLPSNAALNHVQNMILEGVPLAHVPTHAAAKFSQIQCAVSKRERDVSFTHPFIFIRAANAHRQQASINARPHETFKRL